MHKLYHIKGKKWGCSIELEDRLSKQGYTLKDVCEIIEILDVNKAADMERELNIRDGYGWNSSQDYRIITKACTLGGKVAGKLAKESGQLQQALARSCEVRKIPVRVKDKLGNIIGEYQSQIEASKELKVSKGNITSVISGKRKSAGGYKFEKL
jgi:hypothetical protein